MSLLLDALKRAEQEKLARRGEREFTPEREAANAPSALAAREADPALELQPLSPPPGVSPIRPEAAQRAAQAVFAAKAAPREEARGRDKGMMWVLIGVIAIAIVAACAYVWYSISALTPKAVASTRVRPPPLAPTSSGSIPPSTIALPAAVPPDAATTPFTPLPAAPALPPARASTPSSGGELAQRILAQAPAASTPAPLKLARSAEALRVPGDVATGYAALREGDLAGAKRSYQAALAADPLNVDAQLGIATVEARTGNASAASLHYRKALEADPRNATALAGLASLAEFSRPEQIESQLREDVSRYPQSAALRFALGNLFASQSRWREAQGEFFEALRIDPAGADILFNLAVSLDHLGQGRVAADYYARALEAARTQPAVFDAQAASRRMAELRR
jgi:Tfp pilus assembly protein PilF